MHANTHSYLTDQEKLRDMRRPNGFRSSTRRLTAFQFALFNGASTSHFFFGFRPKGSDCVMAVVAMAANPGKSGGGIGPAPGIGGGAGPACAPGIGGGGGGGGPANPEPGGGGGRGGPANPGGGGGGGGAGIPIPATPGNGGGGGGGGIPGKVGGGGQVPCFYARIVETLQHGRKDYRKVKEIAKCPPTALLPTDFPPPCSNSRILFSACWSFASASCLLTMASSNFCDTSTNRRSSSARDFSTNVSINGCTSI